ncbi:apolipoprotein N-acyltransferase [Thalassoglobus polymorphus]|uniref:Apolipoprotein N-acyltransferase n=1 Tax=Thalassoglobus polymorphus TaxID=2527994 RepID=A0A517QLS5_9PLAN|nr:apolipoprotein N-acyltransferase [Thalassoglobus polymorphus]QDT32582.1 Apolipoprotein N-acyltransferase [Thalassoglobus polymorphus]
MDDMTASKETANAPAGAAQGERIEKIISAGRHTRPGGWGTVVLISISACLTWASFTPVDVGPLAWVCLVPLLMLARIEHRTSRMYRSLYVVGFVMWLITLQWMRLGDPLMYFALLALSAYMAFFWPIFIALTRSAVWRYRTPLYIAAPVFWVGLEYLRAYLISGFSWYYIGHTQHNWVEIIQVSDIFGAYGVSFLVVMANAAIAQAIPLSWISKFRLTSAESLAADDATPPRRRFQGVVVSVVLVGIALGYGVMRRNQSEFTPGPRVSLIQGNFPASLKSDREQWGEIYQTHNTLTGLTVPYQPDVIIWPEAMFRYPMMEYDKTMSDDELDTVHPMLRTEDWKNRNSQDSLVGLSEKTDAALVIGIIVADATREGVQNYNSAVFVEPDGGLQNRYDKIHRVPFGEYIPFQSQLKNVPIIGSLAPMRGEYGIDAGSTVEVFEHKDWRILPTICFEDTVPHLVRGMVNSASDSEKNQVDLLVNLTNDGWFHGSSELDQHLITSSFRAVETRTPIVRAVNTGISAIIDGDGVIRDPEYFIDLDAKLEDVAPRESMRDPKTGKFYRQLNCALVADVPIDDRTSLYVRFGDWFAAMCLVATIAVAIQLLPLLRKRSQGTS